MINNSNINLGAIYHKETYQKSKHIYSVERGTQVQWQTMTRTCSKIVWKEKHTKKKVRERQRREQEIGKRDAHEEWATLGLIGGEESADSLSYLLIFREKKIQGFRNQVVNDLTQLRCVTQLWQNQIIRPEPYDFCNSCCDSSAKMSQHQTRIASHPKCIISHKQYHESYDTDNSGIHIHV